MPYPDPKPGLVISYDYLWRDEHEQGHTLAKKSRPCIIAAVQQTDQGLLVAVWPITHTAQEAVPLPPRVAAHLGLDTQPQFIVASETNSFIWPGPDLKPYAGSSREGDVYDYGEIPAALFAAIQAAFAKHRAAGGPGPVHREFDPGEELRRYLEDRKKR
ncbi:MAG TPA: growth inhibitor PemK [Gammaproteobacteria bacterium]|nr:growth inhibitor PemK [Gammaproteobacteria bacterium]